MDAQHRFGNKAFEPSLLSSLTFEATSLVGRLLSRKRRTPEHPLLHLGCGPIILPDFENLDFYSAQWKFWKTNRIGHDLRYTLPYSDDAFEGVFSEHMLEHLTASDAMKLLGEVHRVLKPGAIFRVIVPDLKRYIDFYQGHVPDPEFNKFANGCEALWSLTHNWGHQSCWDSQMLIQQLLDAQFVSAKETGFCKGSDSRLLQDLEERRWESVYVEAIA